jgi:hypothetical protein
LYVDIANTVVRQIFEVIAKTELKVQRTYCIDINTMNIPTVKSIRNEVNSRSGISH